MVQQVQITEAPLEILGGSLFAVAGAGESHGPGITTIVFGCPPGLDLSTRAIQPYLNRRRPGGTKHGTPRHEADWVVFLSGIYQDDHDALLAGPEITIGDGETKICAKTYDSGFSTGEPIAALVLSAAKKSRHYDQFRGTTGAVRPGHTDLVKFHQSRGFVDVRGGGRSSYRSTISDVIGGSIARLYLAEHFGTAFLSSIVQVGGLTARHTLSNAVETLRHQFEGTPIPAAEISRLAETLSANELHALDADFSERAAAHIKQVRLDGDSVGAMVEVIAVNMPPLVGDPLYQSLKLQLMGLLGGLHAAQSVEAGDGSAVVSRRGSENNDPIRHTGYQRNSHGGMLGGISTGAPLVFRVGFKPTSTINKLQQSVRKDLSELDFQLEKGRHDPCVGVRAGITLESRLAIGVMNAALMHAARHLHPDDFQLF